MPQVAETQGSVRLRGRLERVLVQNKKKNQSSIICQGLGNDCTMAALSRSYCSLLLLKQGAMMPVVLLE